MAMEAPANERARFYHPGPLVWAWFVLPPIAAAAVAIYRATKVPAGKRFRHGCLASLVGWPVGVAAFVLVDFALIQNHVTRSIGKESVVAVFAGIVGVVTSPVAGIIAEAAGRWRDSRQVDSDA
jgi:hypothetical protein